MGHLFFHSVFGSSQTGIKCVLSEPQIGHCHSSGKSFGFVPDLIMVSGSPRVSSYSKTLHTLHLYRVMLSPPVGYSNIVSSSIKLIYPCVLSQKGLFFESMHRQSVKCSFDSGFAARP